MDEAGNEYLKLIKEHNLKAADITKAEVVMVSSCTGKLLTANDMLKDDYWVQNLVSPVRFSQALHALVNSDGNQISTKGPGNNVRSRFVDHLVEIGPHSALSSAIKETLALYETRSSIEYSCVMSRGEDNAIPVLSTAASLYCRGYPIAFHSITPDRLMASNPAQLLTNLPSYSFHHSQTYWAESKASKRLRRRGAFPLAKTILLSFLASRVVHSHSFLNCHVFGVE
jgi:acyl transferase domain-containing protein